MLSKTNRDVTCVWNNQRLKHKEIFSGIFNHKVRKEKKYKDTKKLKVFYFKNLCDIYVKIFVAFAVKKIEYIGRWVH